MDIPFQATWKATWVSEDTANSLPNGTSALHNYKLNKQPPKNKKRTAPPTPPHRQCGWLPRHTTYTTHPISPDLDAIPTGTFEITAHPTFTEIVLLHGPDGRLISTITKPRLRKLSNIYHPQDTAISFPEAISDAIHRHNTTTYRVSHTKERKLHKQHTQTQHIEYEEPWPIPDALYDALCNCFKIKRVIHCKPMILPLRAKEYIPHDPRDAVFGALPYTKIA